MGATVPDDVKKVVAFIYVEDSRGIAVPNGTGFFVSVANEEYPDRLHVYLVTAKHVLTNGEGGALFPRVTVRLDKRDGGTESPTLPLLTSGPKKNVFTSSDTTVDIAVIQALPDHKVIDFKALSLNLITSQEDFPKLHISEGSEVFFTGLFLPHVGSSKNYPVVRFGRVALLSDEKVSWNGVPTDLYLIESSSYGGNSGSPVFLYLGADREPGSVVIKPPELRLAGVMKGAFQDIQPIKAVATTAVSVSVSNIGIAAVVPSYHLRNILLSPELVLQRKRAVGK